MDEAKAREIEREHGQMECHCQEPHNLVHAEAKAFLAGIEAERGRTKPLLDLIEKLSFKLSGYTAVSREEYPLSITTNVMVNLRKPDLDSVRRLFEEMKGILAAYTTPQNDGQGDSGVDLANEAEVNMAKLKKIVDCGCHRGDEGAV